MDSVDLEARSPATVTATDDGMGLGLGEGTSPQQGYYKRPQVNGYHDADGYEPVREAKATKLEKLYMGIAFLECFLVFAIGFTYFGLIQANIPLYNAKTRTTPVYIAIFMFAQVYSLFYVYDALRLRNVIQLLLHLFLNLCILIYAIVQIPQTKDTINSLGNRPCNNFVRCSGPDSLENTVTGVIIVMPIVIGLCSIGFGVLVKRLYEQFGWASFHLIGASPQMKRIHREYQTLISLLKLLVYFGMAFCIAYLILVLNARDNTAEFVITILALPIMLAGVLTMGFAARREIKSLMLAMLALTIVGLAYFIYKLASMFAPATAYLYNNTKITMTVFAVFAIIILMLTFGYGCIVMSNFGLGLREVHENPGSRTTLWQPPVPTRFAEKGQSSSSDEEQRPTYGKDPQSRNALVID